MHRLMLAFTVPRVGCHVRISISGIKRFAPRIRVWYENKRHLGPLPVTVYCVSTAVFTFMQLHFTEISNGSNLVKQYTVLVVAVFKIVPY